MMQAKQYFGNSLEGEEACSDENSSNFLYLAISLLLWLGFLGSGKALASYEYGEGHSGWQRDQLMKIVIEEAERAGLEPELALAVARVESDFDPDARSHAGAIGLMQIMPATARGEFGVSPWRLRDPRTNARVGTQFLASLLDKYR